MYITVNTGSGSTAVSGSKKQHHVFTGTTTDHHYHFSGKTVTSSLIHHGTNYFTTAGRPPSPSMSQRHRTKSVSQSTPKTIETKEEAIQTCFSSTHKPSSPSTGRRRSYSYSDPMQNSQLHVLQKKDYSTIHSSEKPRSLGASSGHKTPTGTSYRQSSVVSEKLNSSSVPPAYRQSPIVSKHIKNLETLYQDCDAHCGSLQHLNSSEPPFVKSTKESSSHAHNLQRSHSFDYSSSNHSKDEYLSNRRTNLDASPTYQGQSSKNYHSSTWHRRSRLDTSSVLPHHRHRGSLTPSLLRRTVDGSDKYVQVHDANTSKSSASHRHSSLDLSSTSTHSRPHSPSPSPQHGTIKDNGMLAKGAGVHGISEARQKRAAQKRQESLVATRRVGNKVQRDSSRSFVVNQRDLPTSKLDNVDSFLRPLSKTSLKRSNSLSSVADVLRWEQGEGSHEAIESITRKLHSRGSFDDISEAMERNMSGRRRKSPKSRIRSLLKKVCKFEKFYCILCPIITCTVYVLYFLDLKI